jgi:diguanylate cyclase (GGDEF)-like protein
VADDRERRAVTAGEPADAFDALRALRVAGARLREQAALGRAAAAADRAAAAADREQAAADRRHAGLDELTGVFRRGTGELAVTQEIARSRRFRRPMVLAMLDVDALKIVNDRDGHAAGDALLRDVVSAVTSAMRSYDVTVRWGGDEFVCALSDVTAEVAAERVAGIQRALHELRPGATVTAGLATLGDADSVESLVARADELLCRAKAARSVPDRGDGAPT